MEQSTETGANNALIEAYIGPYNKSFYLRAFDKIRDRGQLGWHWPAMFATLGWLLYRKMWLYGFLYIFVLPIAHIILTSLIWAAAGESVGNLFWISTYVVIAFVLAPLFANRLYYRHASRKVAALQSSGASHEQQLALAADKGGTSVWALVGVAFLGVPLVGIVAAIVIPAYQDYTIRAQVAEGLSLASGARTAVAETYMRTGEMPADNASAGLPPSTSLTGNYVSAIEVYSGDVYIIYGNQANSFIQDSAIVLSPSVDALGNITWACGSEDIPERQLPSFCR